MKTLRWLLLLPLLAACGDQLVDFTLDGGGADEGCPVCVCPVVDCVPATPGATTGAPDSGDP
jgi:hypothetical protein